MCGASNATVEGEELVVPAEGCRGTVRCEKVFDVICGSVEHDYYYQSSNSVDD